MMKKYVYDSRGFFVLVIGIFMISSVLGFGVSPARTMLDFEPGMQKDISFNVFNSEEKDISFVLMAQGDLKDYISSDISGGSILASEGSKRFSYSLNLPDKLEPGLHVGEVVVMQLPGEESGVGSHVLATLAVVTQVHVYVPYPGKYANAKLYVHGANVGEPVRFVVPVASIGEFDLTSVSANVDIYTKAGEKVDSFNIESIEIASGKQKELVYNWKKEIPVGDYIAKVTVIYDEGTISLEEKFSIGVKELELQEVWASDFNLGNIAKLEMLVENKWSEKIEDVMIRTTIFNERGAAVSEFKSSDYSIEGLSKEVFISYWNTAGVIEGDYDAEISINYDDSSSKKNLKFEVADNELVVIGLGYVISDSEENGSDNTLLIVIILLVLMKLVWFFLFRKKLRRGK